MNDAALIAACSTVEHEEAVGLLQQTLEEEEAADERLTEIAEGTVNPAAPMGHAS